MEELMHATEHFRQRVRERIGGVDPDHLALSVVEAIDRGDLRYLGRVTKDGLRAFWVQVDYEDWVVLVDTDARRCVTVLRPEGNLMRHHRAGGPISME
jgi:hypothetical protein